MSRKRRYITIPEDHASSHIGAPVPDATDPQAIRRDDPMRPGSPAANLSNVDENLDSDENFSSGIPDHSPILPLSVPVSEKSDPIMQSDSGGIDDDISKTTSSSVSEPGGSVADTDTETKTISRAFTSSPGSSDNDNADSPRFLIDIPPIVDNSDITTLMADIANGRGFELPEDLREKVETHITESMSRLDENADLSEILSVLLPENMTVEKIDSFPQSDETASIPVITVISDDSIKPGSHIDLSDGTWEIETVLVRPAGNRGQTRTELYNETGENNKQNDDIGKSNKDTTPAAVDNDTTSDSLNIAAGDGTTTNDDRRRGGSCSNGSKNKSCSGLSNGSCYESNETHNKSHDRLNNGSHDEPHDGEKVREIEREQDEKRSDERAETEVETAEIDSNTKSKASAPARPRHYWKNRWKMARVASRAHTASWIFLFVFLFGRIIQVDPITLTGVIGSIISAAISISLGELSIHSGIRQENILRILSVCGGALALSVLGLAGIVVGDSDLCVGGVLGLFLWSFFPLLLDWFSDRKREYRTYEYDEYGNVIDNESDDDVNDMYWRPLRSGSSWSPINEIFGIPQPQDPPPIEISRDDIIDDPPLPFPIWDKDMSDRNEKTERIEANSAGEHTEKNKENDEYAILFDDTGNDFDIDEVDLDSLSPELRRPPRESMTDNSQKTDSPITRKSVHKNNDPSDSRYAEYEPQISPGVYINTDRRRRGEDHGLL